MTPLEKFKKHWLGRIFLIAAVCISGTWYVSDELFVKPRDFEIQALTRRVRVLEKQITNSNTSPSKSGKSKIDDAIVVPQIPVKSLGLSEFGNEWARNNYGREWKIFNDNKWGGESVIWYEIVQKEYSNDHFLSLHFDLSNSRDDEYCGIYTEFSDPPYGILDVSPYTGIEFDARYNQLPQANSPRFFVQVAVLGIPNYAYHEVEFTFQKDSKIFMPIQIHFSKLKTPGWAGTEYELDLSKVFRIGFTINGNGAVGVMDIDNLRLIK